MSTPISTKFGLVDPNRKFIVSSNMPSPAPQAAPDAIPALKAKKPRGARKWTPEQREAASLKAKAQWAERNKE